MNYLISVLILSAVMPLILGVFLVAKPSLAIELQRRFYALINWRIEPISMKKEIRNTRLMGFLLFVVLIAAVLFLAFSR
ncbi:MAG: hypothetical protein PHO70_01890 [Candidatus Omnitrophica bacterium]|nr:hypothetical protein [Candidatus Omnitrophota bacterium]